MWPTRYFAVRMFPRRYFPRPIVAILPTGFQPWWANASNKVIGPFTP